MKRITEDRGYRTTTEFDAESGRFVQVAYGYPDFAALPHKAGADILLFKKKSADRKKALGRSALKKVR